MTDYANLTKLAQQATPGPWAVDAGHDPDEFWFGSGYDLLEPSHVPFGDGQEADAAYIAAASPDVVLALLTELQRARAVVEVARTHADVTHGSKQALGGLVELRQALAAYDAP